ncbi:glycoside hydrolase family 78 protein [Frondihabitans australicus]|uniref:alpha-L-rhamnosidase n=1 Tax=Frondihabitans australicus TaxID=386892 RepID=A0A495IC70_9MICO|nr:glycoside hydrolase family 78 protein [Frondihabitans australicus]RKR73593.1 alpha-L-rhamnosidase [Frondihabitans australicus]
MSTSVGTLRAETRDDSEFVATPTPRLSWTTTSSSPDWTQEHAEVRLDGEEVVELSGRDSVLVPWPFSELAERSTHTVEVRVAGSDGAMSEWSSPVTVRAGFRDTPWAAPLVGLDTPSRQAQPLLLRRVFAVSKPVRQATLYATAHGVYQAEINGRVVDDETLKPGWSAYGDRLIHETTDVTALVAEGDNAIGFSVAGGWFTESFGFRDGARPFYGADPAVAASLVIDYADGSSESVDTDGSWLATGESPVVASGIYAGESYDARLEKPGWSTASYDASGWAPVRIDGVPSATVTARVAPAVRPIQEVAVESVVASASGEQILDFGQNLVGRLRIRVSGPKGTVVTLKHAEVLEHGELGLRPLRAAKATDTYSLKGEGVEEWEPEFTFHGFRYAQVTGLESPLDPSDVTAVVLHSDMRRTGWFESSHTLLNQLHQNVVWGMKGNFLSLPTDCPQRDERLGWTGDIEVFSPTASFLFDTDAFLSSWLVDLDLEQKATGTGSVPFVIPNVLHDAATPAAAWGDAATVVPTVLHERFGDVDVVARQYDSMKAWSDCLLAISGDTRLWEGGFQFGDWLDPVAPPEHPADAATSPDIVASAYLYRSVSFTAEAARLLGRSDDAERYGAIADEVRAAFLAAYVDSSSVMSSDAQTAYATAIVFGLTADDAQRDAMGSRLAALVSSNDYRIGTGFVGTPIITDALTVTGHLGTAEKLLLETKNPSWLYPVTMGATTIWERWDSMLEDGTINPGEMTSFNHYALGAVADWLHRTVAGLAPAEPGYRVVRVAPRPLDALEHAKADFDSPYGRVSVGWHRDGDRVVVEATIPANATAEVSLPGSSETLTVGSGSHSWTVDALAVTA